MTRSKPGYIEITHRSVDKGRALQTAAASVGVRTQQLLAAGDGANDLSMLTISGHSVAMAHSRESLKRRARVVLGSNNDDTLVQYVSTLFGLSLPKA